MQLLSRTIEGECIRNVSADLYIIVSYNMLTVLLLL